MVLSMSDYLVEMREEITVALERLWREHRAVETLETQIEAAHGEMHHNYERVESMNADPYLDDDDGIATGLYWETYFGADKVQHDLTKSRNAIQSDLKQHSLARANAAGAILQYAKQAVSQCHGKNRNSAPFGRRQIAGQSLRDVIWEGRNQSEHWDEGAFKPNVDAVFAALDVHFPGRSGDYQAHKKQSLP